MLRSSSILALLLILAPPVLAQDLSVGVVTLQEIEIVGGPERWPDAVFEPSTRLEPGLGGEALADRFAYRAAEYDVQAARFRLYGEQARWQGMNVYGDRYVDVLHEDWARTLDEAAQRSRELSVLSRIAVATPEAARGTPPR